MMLISFLSLLGATADQAGKGAEVAQNPIISFLPFILIFVVFYFLFIRPQSKKQKEHGSMLQSLQKGEKVITSGGLIGTIVGVGTDTVTIRFGDNFKTEVGKSYISGKVSDPNA
jgi:preprotein translocase subunit YajC